MGTKATETITDINPFDDARDKFERQQRELIVVRDELRMAKESHETERLSLEGEIKELRDQIAMVNDRYQVFKDVTENELSRLRQQNEYLTGYTQELRVRIKAARELMESAEDEAVAFARRMPPKAQPAPAEGEEEALAGISEHFQREAERQNGNGTSDRHR